LPVGSNSVITNFSLTGNILTLELDNASPVTVDLSTIGITTAQSNAIVANTNKVGITPAQASAITTNTAKVGITQAEINKLGNVPTNTNTEKQNTLVSGTNLRTINGQTLLGSGNIDVSGGGGGTIYSAGTGLTLTNSTVFSLAQTVEDRIALNDAKTGITVGQASSITANNSKVGITTGQASAIVANTAKTGITTAQSNAIVSNTNKVGITAQQSTDITTNNSKTGITTAQSNAIVDNTGKIGITAGQASEIVDNTAKVGIPTGGTTNQVLAKTSDTNFATAWVTPSAGGGDIAFAVSDETTALTTGLKLTFRMPYAMTLTGVRASLTTASVGSTVIADINVNGTSILSTKLSIDANEKTSVTAATAPVISNTALISDDEITIDIDQIGSSTAGAGLKIYLLGFKN